MSQQFFVIEPGNPYKKPVKAAAKRIQERYNDKGIFYRDGMGCREFDNCFKCPHDDCVAKNFGEASGNQSYMASKGDGIRPPAPLEEEYYNK